MAKSTQADPVGRPLDRVDGALKVTGKANYAAEYATQGTAAYGFIASASIGKGRILAVDARDARRAPGVLLVLTKDNAPSQPPWGPVDLRDRFARAEPALNTNEVLYSGFPVAFVVAGTFEQASAAATMVRIQYDALEGDYDLHAAGPSVESPGRMNGGMAADSAVGDFESAFGNAPVRIDANYTTPYQHQAPMEPHATVAAWEGEMLTVRYVGPVDDKSAGRPCPNAQHPRGQCPHHHALCRRRLRQLLAILCRCDISRDCARALRRPVKVAMTRPQVFHTTTHRIRAARPAGANRDGRLIAYGQVAFVHCARFRHIHRAGCGAARMLYAAPNPLTRHRRAKLDLPRSD